MDSMDDPFDWDVDRVVQELCTSESRPWLPKVHRRFDPVALSAALRENEIDGETLLTYEDVMTSINGLLQTLGLSKPAHQITLVKAITHLKSQSPLYHKNKADELRLSLEPSLEPMNHTQEARNTTPILPSNTQDIDMKDALPQESQSAGNTTQNASSAQRDAVTITRNRDEPDQMSPPASHIGRGESSPEPPKKKRRVAPSLISSDVSGPIRIPTAADGISLPFPLREQQATHDNTLSNAVGDARSRTQTKKPVWVDATPNAYFGRDSLITADWVPTSSLTHHDDKVHSPSSIQNEEVNHVTTGLVARGRRLQINRAMRGLFHRNNGTISMMRSGISPYLEPSDEDKLLPVFGDSDDDGYDSDTLREMEEEEEERRTELEKKSNVLTVDDMSRVISEEIQRIEESWTERKLPKKERKAKAIWNKARRARRIHLISHASSRLENLEKRIQKLCDEMQKNEYTDEASLRRQVGNLEASIEDRKADKWLLGILRGPEPPGPETMPRLRLPVVPRENREHEDGELITTDDEDDDFIVDDTEAMGFASDLINPHSATPMDLDDLPQETTETYQQQMTPKHVSPVKIKFIKQSSQEVIDLTGVDSEPGSQEQISDTINLVTPMKPVKRKNSHNESPAQFPEAQFTDIPFHQPREIAKIPLKVWQEHQDSERLLIAYIYNKLEPWQRDTFFHTVQTTDPTEYWDNAMLPALKGDTEEDDAEGVFLVARLFRVYALRKLPSSRSKTKKLKKTKALLEKSESYKPFCDFVETDVAPHFTGKGADPNTDASERDTEDEVDGSPSKKRKKRIVLDQTALNLRQHDQQRLEEQDMRRRELRKKLAASALISSDESRLIINESKQDDQGLIYVNADIGRRIKDHQIKGVRFMWNQIVCDAKVRQGCLLAHTMGLGKTMQVITFLTAIAEASQSQDESIRSQIPEDLRRSKTLILCPSLLVNNWDDELLTWAPHRLLGQLYKIEAATPEGERLPIIRQWDQQGGVMIIGYDLFRRLLGVPDENPDEAPDEVLNEAPEADTMLKILTQGPNIVIADEAHKMKNPTSKIGLATTMFKTHSRIALTGSPLANNVEEYYHMINWVAPGYLGPIAEFREVYANPIQQGLYDDVPTSHFRKAKKQLAVLEQTVAPKVNRATIESCRMNLPPKTEFILTVPLTPLQATLYDDFIRVVRGEIQGLAAVNTLASANSLALIVNHPRCYYNRLKEERQSSAETSKHPGKRGEYALTLPPIVVAEALRNLKRAEDLQSPAHSWKAKILVAILDESAKYGDKVLVFSQSIPTLDYLTSVLRSQKRKFARLDGKVATKDRQKQVKDFNTGDMQVYLISTTAGGVGLNIYGANRVVLFDYKYNPVHEQQAVGRAYRIGQQKKVFVYKFEAGGTFESAMLSRSVFKMQLASRVVDKENPRRWSKKDNEYLKDREEPRQMDLGKQAGKDNILDSILKDPELSVGIRNIRDTNSFQEDDPSEGLTAEEMRDVDELVRMNNLRITNPKEFRRLEQERLDRLRASEQIIPLGSQMPATTDSADSNSTANALGKPFDAESRPPDEARWGYLESIGDCRRNRAAICAFTIVWCGHSRGRFTFATISA
ncbi:Protein CHROMATIN REMODELING 20 [Colletotrichum sidae]|uniref:Protein CHROMATIN REMODELING 20 n=1 Tax=Colletotrichum sidae TaxID=1347389 RepID=A0A4R8TL44_9PEZI|nr:Protein CHROMATIN REMODELING 20 [Colletotrichum sidae]